MTEEYLSRFKGMKTTILLDNGNTHTGYLADVTSMTNPNGRRMKICVFKTDKEDILFTASSVKAIAFDNGQRI